MAAVGKGNGLAGFRTTHQGGRRKDARPLWVPVWGGPNVLAQALWKVRATRSPKELQKFVAKLRVYTISDQDDSGPWIRKTFPELFYIASPGVHAGGAYHFSTWSGISGDKFHGRFTGADFSIVDNPWLDEHIRAQGPAGRAISAGQIPHGRRHAELPQSHRQWPERSRASGLGRLGWALRALHAAHAKWFAEPETRPFWTDAEDEVLGVDGHWHTTNHATIWRWRAAYQNDFAARMDWTIKPCAEANHPPVRASRTRSSSPPSPASGSTLSAEGSTDPDGNALSYRWFYYPEPGTLTVATGRTGAPVTIEKANERDASFVVPKNFLKPGTMHIILAVTDNGTPALTRYRRVIVTVPAT